MKKNKTSPQSIIFDTTIVLGIDYSYKEVGLAILYKGSVEYVDRINFQLIEAKNNVKLRKKHRRAILRKKVDSLVNAYHVTAIIVERIRLFSRGFVSMPTIIALGELIAAIIDAVPDALPVFSTETRVWKKRIHGNASAQKQDTVKWAQQHMTISLFMQRGERSFTHNEADALALAFFAYHADAPRFLKREE